METKIKTESEFLFKDLDKPSLHALSYVLRHPDLWPAGFSWNYNWCHQCAMGLAHQLWKSFPVGAGDHNAGASVMARAFGIPFTEALKIFYGHGDWAPVKNKRYGFLKLRSKTVTDFGKVTPDMVADQIDEYLVTAE